MLRGIASSLLALLLAGITSLASGATIVFPSQGGTGIANNNAATLTRSGSHALTLTTTGTTGITLPTSGTVCASGNACSATTVTGTLSGTFGAANTNGNPLALDTTNALGLYVAGERNGSTKWLFGAGKQILSSLGVDDFAIDCGARCSTVISGVERLGVSASAVTTGPPLAFTGAAAATVLATTPAAGTLQRITDVGGAGSGSLWMYGTRWAPITGTLTLTALGAQVGSITAQTTILQALIPAGAWQTNDVIRIWIGVAKSGAVDTCQADAYVGTAGTSADASILTAVLAGASNRTAGGVYDFKLNSATAVQRVGAFSTPGSWIQQTSGVQPSAVTITSAAANALYVTVTLQRPSGSSDTCAVTAGQIQLVTPAGA